MSNTDITISIIIVNYNVKDFLEQALDSAKRALKDISSEIIVVDNASIDGSVQLLNNRFPDVTFIENEKNVGFSAGNNIGLRLAKGKFIVLLNPDTVVQEDTFSKLLEFFEENPKASAATCKILNPDGTFSIDCRHSIPSPSAAFWKLTGLSRIFPKSKIFGRYNLTYLDENDTYPVEAISGSFMMMKKEIVNKVGELDEDFFMYCEDIDYCHRINQAGGQIYYVPDSQIIHYKGESTKKNNFDYVVTFNRSLYQFYKKHYQQKYAYPFKWLILLGTIFRGIMIFIKNNLSLYYSIVLDTVILNLVMFFTFWVRYELTRGFSLHDFFSEYIVINIITTLTYFLASLFFDSLNKDRYSITKIIKANIVTFTFVSALVFFFNQLAFSRLVVLTSAMSSPLLMVLWRLILRMYSRRSSSVLGQDYFLKRTLIVGYDNETKQLLEKLKGHIGVGIEITGLVSLDKKDVGEKLAKIPVVTSLQQLPEYIRLNKINLIIFTTHNIPYEAILTTMSRAQNPRIEFKMVPGHFEFIIGKSNIERLDAVPLVDIEYAYGRPFNYFLKRSFDLFASGLILIMLLPVYLILFAGNRKQIIRRPIFQNNKTISVLWCEKKGLLKFILQLFNIFTGKMSFVGAPLVFNPEDATSFDYKAGLTGLVQISRDRILSEQDRQNYELHYLKNQNLLFDLEILFKALFKSKKIRT